MPALKVTRIEQESKLVSKGFPWIIDAISSFIFCLGGAAARVMLGHPWPPQETGPVKIAEGEYVVHERKNGGAFGPFGEETYNFHESFTLFAGEKAHYDVKGVRRFESSRDVPHSNRFTVELDRDLTVIRATEFAKLRWVQNSGPLSCEFLAAEMDCSRVARIPSEKSSSERR